MVTCNRYYYCIKKGRTAVTEHSNANVFVKHETERKVFKAKVHCVATRDEENIQRECNQSRTQRLEAPCPLPMHWFEEKREEKDREGISMAERATRC